MYMHIDPILKKSREIWHSHVFQATWEARTVGWLETERSPPPGEWCLWPHYGRHAGRRSTEEVKLLWREDADCKQQQQQVQAATSSRDPARNSLTQSDSVFKYCNCKILKNPCTVAFLAFNRWRYCLDLWQNFQPIPSIWQNFMSFAIASSVTYIQRNPQKILTVCLPLVNAY